LGRRQIGANAFDLVKLTARERRIR